MAYLCNFKPDFEEYLKNLTAANQELERTCQSIYQASIQNQGTEMSGIQVSGL